jgi:N12 class adenine-specific DNA methylase/phospholipid N-methyltransferase
MARKFDLISQLYEDTSKEVMSPDKWAAFLKTACYNYRLRFDEQLLLYAQKPDATAVLPIEQWNRTFGRWVNRGAKGIAVFESLNGNSQRLVHYFDISDTHASENSRAVPIWNMKPEYTDEVIDTLESSFGYLNEKNSLTDAIISASGNAVEDNIPDYVGDLLVTVNDTFLEELDEDIVKSMYRQLVSNSVAFMIMTRLGFDTEPYFNDDDFRDIVNFNTQEALNALGFATSDIAEMGLSEISKTVLALNRQNRIIAENRQSEYTNSTINTERSLNNGRTDIHNAGRLPASEPDASRTAEGTARTLRSDEEELSVAEAQNSLLQSADEGNADRTPVRNRTDGDRDGGQNSQTDGGAGGRDREAESGRPDEVDTPDEQPQTLGSGDSQSGSDLRLEYYDRSNEDKSIPFFGGDDKIKAVLLSTPYLKATKTEIARYFENESDSEKQVKFIKSIFNNDATDITTPDGKRMGYKTYQNVLLLWEGEQDNKISQAYYNWGVIAGYFEGMRLLGELRDTTKPLPSLKGQLEILTAEAGEKTPAFAFSQEIIDAVLTHGSGVSEGKMRIYEQFQKSLSVKENIDFLKNEYGWGGSYPIIIGTGIDESHDGKGIMLSRGFQDNAPRLLLNWGKVEKRIGELIKLDRYLNSKEKEYYPTWLEKQEQIKAERAADREIREAIYTPPAEKETIPIDYEYKYSLGASVYIGADEYEILSFDENRVMLFDKQFPIFNKEMTRTEFDSKVKENPMNDHLKVAVQPEKEKQITKRDYSRYSPVMQEYFKIKDEHPDTIILFQIGDFYEAMGDDAVTVSQALSLHNTTRRITDTERIDMCGFPSHRLETYTDMLLDLGYNIGISSPNERESRDFILMTSDRAHAPIQSEPIGGIDNSDLIGKELTLDNRRFIVERIDRNGDASMRDITFEDSNGFPIFRVEKADFVRSALELSEKKELDAPVWKRKQKAKAQTFDLHPEIPLADRYTFDLKNFELEEVGKRARFRRNTEAIRVLKQCEEENRFATPEEQKVLAQYVGWGGIPETFDENNAAWQSEYNELSQLLSDEEYQSARESTLTAFYTPPVVISAIYKVMEQMGFKEGNILEPSCGIGNFIGMLPQSMENSRVYGVEIDIISAGIAQQLYQRSSIAGQPFEQAEIPDSFFDAVVGNVPFGDFSVVDKRYDKNHFLIHDYFFAKSLDKLRPGGVMALVTSKGTMDKENSAVRKYIAQRAELLGTIRLPNDTFKGNAGTEVVSDILILQKRDRIIDIEPDWVHLNTDKNGIRMNSYFAEHPEMILGDMKIVSGRFGEETTCVPYENADLESLLDEAVSNIHGEIAEYETEENIEEEDNSIPADPNVRNFSYTVLDDVIYFRENSRMSPVEVSATAENRIKGLIEIRNSVRTLLDLQTEDYPDSDIKAEQESLNKLYDSFTKKYGLINSRANTMAFSQDSSYSLLSSLEILDDEGNLEHKADMFFKRTIKPHTPVTSVDTASEALAVSMGEKADIDMEYMCQLSGKSEQEVFEELKGVIFLNPLYGQGNPDEQKYLMADEYLSGNVREKLEVARRSAKLYPDDYNINVEALERVQPKDLTASEISVRLGATWIPPEIVQQFIYEFLDTPRYAQWKIRLHYSPYTSEWSIENKSYDTSNLKVYRTYGTDRINAYKIIEETLNLKDVRIFDYVEDEEGRKKPVLNKKKTTIALQKQELIKEGFKEWIWKDPQRREKLCKLYNEKFNSTRPREYDGSHITFNGMNPEIELREHQKNAVAHILYGGNTLLAHAVGAGKTYEMTAAAMESKRLGLCSKSLFVVPNHLTEQWAAEFLQLYPAANILVATKKDFETKNRKRFCGRIATGDYDAIIIGHSQFEKIPMSVERQRIILEQQIDEITDGIRELKENRGENFSIKQLEKSRKSLKVKLQKLNDQSRKDDVVTFEELGVDRLFIDESHYYKNLYLYTKMRNVGGIAQTEAQKSSDLFMKCRYLDEITGGRGTVFATGTPISNSMVELYTIQRYLQYETLVENDLQHFDSWASTFGETITAYELKPEGTGYRTKTRFAKFYNLPELMAMFKEVADIKTADTLNLPTPTPHYHNVAVKPSDFQKAMVAELGERAEKVRNNQVDASVDNMLKITNDGRKLALDQRMINSLLPDFESSKINACIDNIFMIWQENADKKSAQLVFCDLSTPKPDAEFSVYTDIRKKLIERGVPKSEISFIHEAKTEAQKQELFKKVRKGEVRVLLGSTQKMGAGTNVQNKLIALHDIDCPWRPSDLEQRSGRIIRQGNENTDVDVYRYVTEETFDAYLYQLVEGKQKFASQIMTSKSPVRSAEDIDDTALSYAEIKMLATGNPYIKEKMDLDIQVQKLRLYKSHYLSEKYELEDKIIKFYPQEISLLTARVDGLKADLEIAKAHPKEVDGKFAGMVIDGYSYTEKAEAGQVIIEACKAKTTSEPTPLGEYRGFKMELEFDTFERAYAVKLKGHFTHSVTLGTDVYGNITRIDNAVDNIETRLHKAEEQMENTKAQLETAKVEVEKPFAQEDELKQKMARLTELNALLDMDKGDTPVLGGEPDEGDLPPTRSRDDRER